MPCAELDLDSVVSPADNLQGAMIVYPCKSLLIRTSAKRDYCPVELCEASGTWRPADVSCGSKYISDPNYVVSL
ncbi:hypothetical protein DPMN_026510 [Dreissena polymorpha]|uniref:Sushi domain-containing protein n=1 Tax=Dreissena polymorpha TaxID=45954 RepID=A0A9D4RCN5_DREPO|nr:hypothetical protein DPMN_026510 [Dreissena polymorpha]